MDSLVEADSLASFEPCRSVVEDQTFGSSSIQDGRTANAVLAQEYQQQQTGSNQHQDCLPILEGELFNLTVAMPRPHYGYYRTINQNEFFVECMINGEGSSLIHFFDKDSPYSLELNRLMEAMAEKFTSCKFLCIDGRYAPFIASKLMISNFPTVLAIRNKIVLDRLTNFDRMDFFLEEYFEDWIVRLIPLIKGF